MAEDFNNINRPAGGSMPDPNRPRLKKVKRPIKRIVNPSNAAGVSAAMPPKAEPVYQPQAQQQTQSPADDFDLDAILDGGENLPALNNTQEVASDFQPQFIDESDIRPPKVPLAEQFMVDNMFTKKPCFSAHCLLLSSALPLPSFSLRRKRLFATVCKAS